MDWNVNEWSKEIVKGPGGLEDYRHHEMAVVHPDPRVEGAIWALRCLSNPDCEGSAEALDAIYERRNQAAKA